MLSVFQKKASTLVRALVFFNLEKEKRRVPRVDIILEMML